MRCRTLGKTGLTVGEIGMGCEGFVGKSAEEVRALVDEMDALGVSCIDLYTPDPTLRTHLGAALQGRRGRFVLQAHLCTVWQDGQYKRTREIGEVKAGFCDLLESLGTDSVEIGMIHYVDAVQDWRAVENGPIMAYAKELKAKGMIGCIGMSSHNPAAALAAVRSGLVDVVMFSINPLYDLMPPDEDCNALFDAKSYDLPALRMDPEREALYETCQRMGVGITVMKAFGGGDLLSAALSPAGRALTPYQCIHYALTRPAVASVLAGAHTVQELRHCAGYETARGEERDYAKVLAAMPKLRYEGHCMYCGHCAPCPRGIDVASVTKFLNLSRAQGAVPETVREHYAALAHTAGECVGCGQCEQRCPFGVPVRENMRRAQALFGR